MRRARAFATILGAIAALSRPTALLAAPDAPVVRGEAPIHEVILSDGTRRYSVPIKIGASTVDTGLDTGSVGLRVLERGLASGDAQVSGGFDSYAYASGARLNGVSGEANIVLGGLSARARIQIVKRVDCAPDIPHCPASLVSAAQYGIQGDGLPGEGFVAIMGVNMGHDPVPNPLIALGVKRWIVELPRPGETTPGRLILNPTEAETAGFVPMPLMTDVLHDSVAGCLVNDASQAKACGPLMMDTGAPGIRVVNGGLGARPWPVGAAATLVFFDGARHAVAAEHLTIGLRAHASHLMFDEEPRRPDTAIFPGLSPYFAFSVLYDPGRGAIGLKPRTPPPGGPVGAVN
jgi:hypothetical protein